MTGRFGKVDRHAASAAGPRSSLSPLLSSELLSLHLQLQPPLRPRSSHRLAGRRLLLVLRLGSCRCVELSMVHILAFVSTLEVPGGVFLELFQWKLDSRGFRDRRGD